MKERERQGARRFRPGVGSSFYSPGMLGTAGTTSRYDAMSQYDLDREIESLRQSLEESGATDHDDLEHSVHGEAWGPGRFDKALREAVEEGSATPLGHGRYGPSNGEARDAAEPAASGEQR
jgi:hypothetical protein